ncbi:4-hydroxy-2-oxovalerate aldolase [Desulfitibacter alkalitolerans]|uniref:4-hydroxy-2-oxovalerate aldolase n=1 Tax=Desulfitibacter alkalitolerans TaxID=264641 RepID=UPI00047FC9BB|nr:4-hydroxy-2-oxovalerate aldolase [Desulfitibacter alkalitolerans]
MQKHIRIVDTTLRDGMHAVSHQFTPEDMAQIAAALDEAGVDTIEIGHGDGLGGTSYQYGFAIASDEEYLKAVSDVLKNARLDVLLLPGIGTKKDLEFAAKYNTKVARIATHVTEADVGEQHIKLAKELGMEAIGFLMMSHMVPPEKIVEQAKLFESYGADVVYVTDSAGAMVPQEVAVKIRAVKEAVSIPVGHHAHNNLSLALANTLAAIEAGADMVDGTCKGLGAGAGNTQTEVLVAVLDKLGYKTGVDLYKIMDVADDIVAPKMKRPQVIDKNSLSIGYAGVYGSFLLHALRASEKFGIDARDILVELGRRKTVGGQEDMIIDVAYELSTRQNSL